MRAVLGARCCGSLLTAAELDVAVHTAHRELQASLRRARSRLLLRATTSTFDHFEFAVFSGSVFAPGHEEVVCSAGSSARRGLAGRPPPPPNTRSASPPPQSSAPPWCA